MIDRIGKTKAAQNKIEGKVIPVIVPPYIEPIIATLEVIKEEAKIPDTKCSVLIEEMMGGILKRHERKIDLFIFFGIIFLAFIKWA